MMLDWVKKNQKLAFKVTGVNFLLMALVLLFWSQPKMVLSENEKAAANVARMEAKAKGNSAPSSTGNIMQEHHQSQKKQLRIFLIIMTISGAVLLGYGFLKKE
jgi:Na+/H+ antiporter NhaC